MLFLPPAAANAGMHPKSDESLTRATRTLRKILANEHTPPYWLARIGCILVLADARRGVMSCRYGGLLSAAWMEPELYMVGPKGSCPPPHGPGHGFPVWIVPTKPGILVQNGQVGRWGKCWLQQHFHP
jgi:hypothetical protein